MATTSSALPAGKVASQGGNRNNGRYGLKAKLVAGVVILGCAAALAFSGLRADQAQQSPAQAAQPASNPYWVYTEDVAVDGDPAAAAMALVRVNPYWTYQEDVILNGNPAQAALDWEQQERGQVAP